MALGSHVTFAAYGFWLPNDPRGSWSTFVGSDAIYEAGGPATKTTDPRSLANTPHDYEARQRTKSALERKPVRFTEIQRSAIGLGFSNYLSKSACPVWACAIMPDHIHLVVGLTPISLDQWVNQLKGAAAKQLVANRCHPFEGHADPRGRLPKCFVQNYWKVFLDDPQAIEGRIRYVEENPTKIGLPAQRWDFVTAYNAGGA